MAWEGGPRLVWGPEGRPGKIGGNVGCQISITVQLLRVPSLGLEL